MASTTTTTTTTTTVSAPAPAEAAPAVTGEATVAAVAAVPVAVSLSQSDAAQAQGAQSSSAATTAPPAAVPSDAVDGTAGLNGSTPGPSKDSGGGTAAQPTEGALFVRRKDDGGFPQLETLRARLNELNDLTPEEQEILNEQALSETAMREAVREIAEVVMTSASDAEKVEFVQNRFMELVQELSDTDVLLSRANRNLDTAVHERDTAQAEVGKLTAVKTRLESLCRELQKESKRVKEESKLLILSEQHKREELAMIFQKAIGEIKLKMEEGEQKLLKAQEGEVAREQLRNIVEQYNLREQHFNSILRSKDLEVKLYEAKLVQQTEVSIQEHQKVLSYKQQHEMSQQRENDLRTQLETYAEKFEQVQDAINKSNEVFNAFKREMEQMTKKLKKMEKENEGLKTRCESMSKNINELQDEKAKHLQLLDTQKTQKAQLESLCRALHNERRDLTSKLERFTKRLEVAEGGPVTDIAPPAPAPGDTHPAIISLDDGIDGEEEEEDDGGDIDGDGEGDEDEDDDGEDDKDDQAHNGDDEASELPQHLPLLIVPSVESA